MKKTTLKKVFAAVLTMTVGAVVLAGCGQNSATNENSSTSAAAKKKVYKVGITQISDHPSLDNCREGFIKGLENGGYKQDENLKIVYLSAQDDMSKNTQIAQNFANDKVDLVCGIATPSAQALYASCYEKKIPVIFNAVSDPVAAKLAKSETEALDGVTGVSDKLPVEAQLKLIREILPDAKKIGIIYSTGEANSVSTLEDYKRLAADYKFEIVEKGIAKKAEVAQAADVLLNEVDCISNMTDNTVVSALAVVLDKANAKGIPVFGSEEEQVANGCIASAGLDYLKLGIQAGEIAAKVLDGEDASSIPYETLKESSVAINEKAAENLKITIPKSVSEGAVQK